MAGELTFRDEAAAYDRAFAHVKARERLGKAPNASVSIEDGQALSFSDESFLARRSLPRICGNTPGS